MTLPFPTKSLGMTLPFTAPQLACTLTLMTRFYGTIKLWSASVQPPTQASFRGLALVKYPLLFRIACAIFFMRASSVSSAVPLYCRTTDTLV